MIERAQIIERIGETICWIAIGLAGCWIAFKDDRFAIYVAVTFFAGLALGIIGSFLREYRLDTSDRKRGLWRRVTWWLVLFFVGGAGLSLFIYFMALHEANAGEGFKQTVLVVAGTKLALGTVAFLSLTLLKRSACT